MHAPAGILLPESVLTSNWFILMATVVAFNTIIYMGLTLSKLIPMPRQFHPERVRGWMRKIGLDPDKDTAVDDIPRPERPDSADPYDQMRMAIARRDIPQAFGLVGALVILISTTSLIIFRATQVPIHVIQLAVGVLFLVVAQVLGRRHFRARTVMWTWATSCVLLVLLMTLEAVRLNSQFPVAYGLIVMTAFAPVVLAWTPSLVAGTAMLAAMSIGAVTSDGDEELRLITAGVAALLVSATLLRLRLTAIKALGDEQARSAALVTTDVLTGTLTRHGLLTVMPTVAGTAERTGEHVCLMYFDVEHLATANEQYGVHYGDDVLRAVASAIQGTVRAGRSRGPLERGRVPRRGDRRQAERRRPRGPHPGGGADQRHQPGQVAHHRARGPPLPATRARPRSTRCSRSPWHRPSRRGRLRQTHPLPDLRSRDVGSVHRVVILSVHDDDRHVGTRAPEGVGQKARLLERHDAIRVAVDEQHPEPRRDGLRGLRPRQRAALREQLGVGAPSEEAVE
jgi:hypothetical protein